MTRPVKAIAMLSGGLDSTLALALVRRQGIAVKAINFYTGFCITETQRRKGGRPDGTVPRNEALRAAADLEVEIEEGLRNHDGAPEMQDKGERLAQLPCMAITTRRMMCQDSVYQAPNSAATDAARRDGSAIWSRQAGRSPSAPRPSPFAQKER